MPNSVRWTIAGLFCAVAGLACTIKARYELRREAEDKVWRETVADVSDINGSSSFPYSPQSPRSRSTGSDSSITSPGESDNGG
jgi:hypothetical protein